MTESLNAILVDDAVDFREDDEKESNSNEQN